MSLICIFAYVCVLLRASLVIDCTCVLRRRGWAEHLAAVAVEPTQFSGFADSPVLLTGRWLKVTWPPLCFKLGRGFTTLLRQILLSEDRQCCESWRGAKLGVCAVCAVKNRLETRGKRGSESPSDTTGEVLVLVRWVVLLCFRHTVTLPWAVWRTICWPHQFSTDCYDD